MPAPSAKSRSTAGKREIGRYFRAARAIRIVRIKRIEGHLREKDVLAQLESLGDASAKAGPPRRRRAIRHVAEASESKFSGVRWILPRPRGWAPRETAGQLADLVEVALEVGEFVLARRLGDAFFAR